MKFDILNIYGLQELNIPIKDDTNIPQLITVKYQSNSSINRHHLFIDECFNYELFLKTFINNRNCLLSAPCGWGKTETSIKLACDLGLKTLILVDSLIVLNECYEIINQLTESQAKIGLIKSNHYEFKDRDFIIAMLPNLYGMECKDIFNGVGLTIVMNYQKLVNLKKYSELLTIAHSKYNLYLTYLSLK